MMTTQVLDENDVWILCSDAYLRHNIKLKMPKCSDQTKTYQWRYVKALTKKLNEWEFDKDTAIKFIDIAVQYAKDLKVLVKGLSVFLQGNMLNICYEKLKESQSVGDNLMARLEASLESMKNIQDKRVHFLKKPDSMSFRNITNYYMSNRVCNEYLALSRAAISALKVISQLDPQERELLPSDANLYLLRIKILDQLGDDKVVRKIVCDA